MPSPFEQPPRSLSTRALAALVAVVVLGTVVTVVRYLDSAGVHAAPPAPAGVPAPPGHVEAPERAPAPRTAERPTPAHVPAPNAPREQPVEGPLRAPQNARSQPSLWQPEGVGG